MMIELAEERCELCSCCTKLQIVNTSACINALEIISLHASLIVRGTEIGSHWVLNYWQNSLRCVVNYSTTKKQTLLYLTVSW